MTSDDVFPAFSLLQGTDTNNSFAITGRHVEIVESEASGSSQATSGSNKVCRFMIVSVIQELFLYH